MYVQPKNLDFILRLIAICWFFLIFVVPEVAGGEIKCTTDSYGNTNCSVFSPNGETPSSSENKSFAVKNPDFLRNRRVVDENNKTLAVCTENFYGNLKCKSK